MTVRHGVENLVGTVAQTVSVEVDVVEAVEAAEAAAGVEVERNAQPTAVVELEKERFDAVVPDEVVEDAVGYSVVQIDANPGCP